MAIAPSNTIVRSVVPKSVAETIRRMARATGKSESRIIAEFLTEAEPAIRRLAGMLEVARKQQALFPASEVGELEAALDRLSGDATAVMDQLQGALQLPFEAKPAKSASPASARRARGAGRRKKGRNPRPVTRG